MAVFYKEGDRADAEMATAPAKFNVKHYGGNVEGFRAAHESSQRRENTSTSHRSGGGGSGGSGSGDLKTPRGMPAALEPLYLAPPAAAAADITAVPGEPGRFGCGPRAAKVLPTRAASPNWPSASPEWQAPDPETSRLRDWQAYDGPSGAGAIGVGQQTGQLTGQAHRRVRVDSRLSWLDKGEASSRLSGATFVSPRGGWTATPGGWSQLSSASPRGGGCGGGGDGGTSGSQTSGSQLQTVISGDAGMLDDALDGGSSSASMGSTGYASAGYASTGCSGRRNNTAKEQWSYDSIAAVPPVVRRLPADKPRAVDHNLAATRDGLGDLEWAQESQMDNLYDYLESQNAKERMKEEDARRYARQGFRQH